MSFPRYPEYKDSGVEWLGWVPSHWSVKAIKWLSPVLRGASPRPIDDPKYFDDDGEYAWVRIADSTASTGMLTETTQRLSALGSSLSVKLEIGQLFVSIAGTVGKPCITAIKACIHDGFVYFPRLQINPKFLFRIFEAGVCYGGLGKMGTQLNLNTDTIGSIRIAVPPPEEMTEVLSFIDRETAKIDALVAEQEKLIALLQEKRQAVISHAVTKGLDPNVPMKDSGVEWLGEVPRHWNINGFRRGIDFLTDYEANGSFADTKAAVSLEEGIPFAWYVRATDLENGRFGLAADNRWCDSTSYDFLQKTQLIGCELLIAKRGEIGKVYLMPIVDCPSTLAPNLYLARLNRTLLPKFAHFWFLSDFGKPQLELCNKSTTIGALYKDDVRSLICPFPPQPEQELISRFLDRETESIQSLIGEAELGINLLQERRTALISAAVTGQIDVRGLAGGANAPDSIAASAYPESAGG